MKKSKTLRKALITGGMAIALLAPMAVSTITPTNIVPTTITAQAKRRHHHKKHESKKVRHYARLRKHRMRTYLKGLHYDKKHHKDISKNYNLLNYVYKANPKTKLGRRMIQWPSC